MSVNACVRICLILCVCVGGGGGLTLNYVFNSYQILMYDVERERWIKYIIIVIPISGQWNLFSSKRLVDSIPPNPCQQGDESKGREER